MLATGSTTVMEYSRGPQRDKIRVFRTPERTWPIPHGIESRIDVAHLICQQADGLETAYVPIPFFTPVNFKIIESSRTGEEEEQKMIY